MGYFSQQRVEVLSTSKEACWTKPWTKSIHGYPTQEVRTLLGAFLFGETTVFKPVKVLSGGEKSRLALVKLLLPPISCCLTSPPPIWTWPSIDAVIQALKEYTGTLIFVSHDLHFIRALGKRTIRIEAGRITNFAGDYDYYLWKSGSASAQTGLIEGLRDARPDQASETESGSKTAQPRKSAGSDHLERKKESPTRQTRRPGSETGKGNHGGARRGDQASCNTELANPDSYNDPEGKELNEREIAEKPWNCHVGQRIYEWEIENRLRGCLPLIFQNSRRVALLLLELAWDLKGFFSTRLQILECQKMTNGLGSNNLGNFSIPRTCVATCSSKVHEMSGGIISVRLFYIISGYLIAMVLSEKYGSLKNFYFSRVLRLLPTYLIVLAVTLLSSCLFSYGVMTLFLLGYLIGYKSMLSFFRDCSIVHSSACYPLFLICLAFSA